MKEIKYTELLKEKCPTPKDILDGMDNFSKTITLMKDCEIPLELAAAILRNKAETVLGPCLSKYIQPEDKELREKLHDVVKDYLDSLSQYKPYDIKVTEGEGNTYTVTFTMEVNDPVERQRLLDTGLFKEV